MKLKIYSVLVTAVALPSIVGLLAVYSGKGWLTFENAAYLATVGGTLVGAATLITIAVQLNHQTRLAKAANSQSFVSISSEFVLFISAHPALMELWQTKGKTYEQLPPVEQFQYRYLVQWWLNFYENIQYQKDCGLLDDGVYKSWMKDMDGFIKRRHVEKFWDVVKSNYSDQFIKHFQPLIDERVKAPDAPAARPETPPQGAARP